MVNTKDTKNFSFFLILIFFCLNVILPDCPAISGPDKKKKPGLMNAYWHFKELSNAELPLFQEFRHTRQWLLVHGNAETGR